MRVHQYLQRPSTAHSRVTAAIAALATLLATGLTLAAGTAPAQAAGLTVTTTADNTTADGACSLREAVGNANDDATTHPDCPAGTGADTITFALGGPATIEVSAALAYSDADPTTIDGDANVTLQATTNQTVLNGTIGANLTLDGLTVTRTSGIAFAGPGVASRGQLVVRDSTFTGLQSFGAGGAISANNAGGVVSLVVSGSTFANNSSTLAPGGAINAGAVPTSITNSTFYDNETDQLGGAIDASDALEVSFSTFMSNTAFNNGGAINGSGTLDGNVFQDNTSTGGTSCSGGVVDGGFNVSDDATCATAATSLPNTDPGLDPAGPADHGGPTDTIALQPGSVAIDLVTPGDPSCPAVDQRGVTRPVDGDDNGTAACDAGSYEAPRPADTTAPVVTVPANITTPATGPSGATVTYTATANDDRDGPLTPTCTPPSGSTFPVGTTTVTCTATDAAGNTGTNTFTVTVTPAVPNKADLKITLTAPATTVPNATISVTATVLNQGPATAVNLNTVIAATGLTTTATNPATGSGSITINGTTITGARWTRPTLATGATVTYTLTGKVTAQRGKTIAVVAGTLSGTPDPQLATNITAKTIKVN